MLEMGIRYEAAERLHDIYRRGEGGAEYRQDALENAAIRAEEERRAHWIGGSNGQATYQVIMYCFCDVSYGKINWHRSTNFQRQDSELTDMYSVPARFLTLSDVDPRAGGPFIMGCISDKFSDKIVARDSGGITFDFSKNGPNISEVSVMTGGDE